MKVGILGAGAIGMPLGYFLSNRERNNVTYLVREKRVQEYSNKTVKLYAYDKKKLIDYKVKSCLPTETLLDDAADVSKYDFDLVIVTLPTDLLLQEGGKNLIKGLTRVGKEDMTFLVLSPGFRIQEEVFEPLGVKRNRVAFGLPLFLCHEVHKSSFNNTEKFKELESADLAFTFLLNSYRIMLVSRTPRNLKRVLRNAKKGKIFTGKTNLEASTAMFIILNLLLYLQGYPRSLKKKDPSFKAAMGAFRQIMSQYGFIGGVMKLFVGKNVMKITDFSNRKFSKPLTTEFLKYHHAGKVKEQNVKIIESYIVDGNQKGMKTEKIEVFVQLCKNSEA